MSSVPPSTVSVSDTFDAKFLFSQIYIVKKHVFSPIYDFFLEKIHHNGLLSVKCVKSLMWQRIKKYEFDT